MTLLPLIPGRIGGYSQGQKQTEKQLLMRLSVELQRQRWFLQRSPLSRSFFRMTFYFFQSEKVDVPLFPKNQRNKEINCNGNLTSSQCKYRKNTVNNIDIKNNKFLYRFHSSQSLSERKKTFVASSVSSKVKNSLLSPSTSFADSNLSDILTTTPSADDSLSDIIKASIAFDPDKSKKEIENSKTHLKIAHVSPITTTVTTIFNITIHD